MNLKRSFSGGLNLKKKFITGLLAATMFVSPFIAPVTASANKLEEMQQEKERLDKENQNIQGNINVKEEKLQSLAEEKSSLEANVVQLQKEIDQVVRELKEQEDKLAAAEEKVIQLHKEIEALKDLIEQRKGKIENQARAVQTDGNSANLLDIVISAENLTDLLGRISLVNQLVDANEEIVLAQIEDQKTLENKQAEAKAKKEAIETLKAEIEMNRNNLVAQKDELDKTIIAVATNYDMTEEEKNAFVKEQEVIAAKTSTLSADMQAEQQRIITEQKAREAAEQKELEEREHQAAEAQVAAEKETANQKVAATQSANPSSSLNSGSSSAPSSKSSSSSTPSSSSNSGSTKSSSGFIRPSGGYTTSPFGYRVHPISGVKKLHGGMDFGGGGPIVAAQGGTVTIAQYHSTWGWYVKIDHGNGLSTLYAHMAQGSLRVSSGQQVSQGQQIGTMGTTGASTGVHLHFEVYQNGVRVNPASYLGM